MYCFAPVLKGFWKQHELWDGTYLLTDLLDIHEAMSVQQANEELIHEYYKNKAENEKEARR